MMHGVNRFVKETLKRIEPNSVGAELGVWKGTTSELFRAKTSKLHLVDSWSVQAYEELESYEKYLDRYSTICGSRNPEDFTKYYDRIYTSVINKFKDDKHVKIWRMNTDKFFEEFNEKVDWFYVDAAHDVEGVYKDLVNSYNHLKKFGGGIIFGDDYGNKKDVKTGVDNFIKDYKLNFNNFYETQYEIKVEA